MHSNTTWQIISKIGAQLVTVILHNPLYFGILEIKIIVETKNTTITSFGAHLKN